MSAKHNRWDFVPSVPFTEGPSFECPLHVWGEYERAVRKHRGAHRRWTRLMRFGNTIDGRRWANPRSVRAYRRAQIHERACGYWHERLQVIAPYLQAALAAAASAERGE